MIKTTPVPVSAAQRIATEYNKSIVVISCMDERCTTTTTFGANPEDKLIAARIGEEISKVTGQGQSEFTEDFRKDFDAAKYKACIDALKVIANYDGESIWNDSRDDAADNMLGVAANALKNCGVAL